MDKSHALMLTTQVIQEASGSRRHSHQQPNADKDLATRVYHPVNRRNEASRRFLVDVCACLSCELVYWAGYQVDLLRYP